MDKIRLNKPVFWKANGTRLSGRVKKLMSEHALVVATNNLQYLVRKAELSVEPMDKLARLVVASPPPADTPGSDPADGPPASFSEEGDGLAFINGFEYEIDFETGQVAFKAINAAGATQSTCQNKRTKEIADAFFGKNVDVQVDGSLPPGAGAGQVANPLDDLQVHPDVVKKVMGPDSMIPQTTVSTPKTEAPKPKFVPTPQPKAPVRKGPLSA